jgi:hypothetical protein
MKRFKAMVQDVDFASWVSLRSLPPKEAIVAVVLKDILNANSEIPLGVAGIGRIEYL